MTNRRKLQRMKREATQQLVLGLLMVIIATIPVLFQWGNGDHTGSLFCWLLAGMLIHDSIRKLIKYNRIG